MRTQEKNLLTWILVSIILLGIFLFWNSKAFSQEWTAEQREVWDSIQNRWASLIKGDVEDAMKRTHENVFLWSRAYPEPNSYRMIKVTYKRWVKIEKPTSARIRPIKINIFGDFANVYYIYKYEGTKLSDKGRVLETLMKQNNKWLLIGGLSSSCDTLPNWSYVW